MPSYTYELQDPRVFLSNLRKNFMAMGGDPWSELATFVLSGHVEYLPVRINPMRSGYIYVYQKAKLNLTLYFSERLFNRMVELLDEEKIKMFKAMAQSSIPERAGYIVNEFKIRGIIGEEE